MAVIHYSGMIVKVIDIYQMLSVFTVHRLIILEYSVKFCVSKK